MKDAHFKAHPEWKWCSKDRKKSSSSGKDGSATAASTSRGRIGSFDTGGEDPPDTPVELVGVTNSSGSTECIPLTISAFNNGGLVEEKSAAPHNFGKSVKSTKFGFQSTSEFKFGN